MFLNHMTTCAPEDHHKAGALPKLRIGAAAASLVLSSMLLIFVQIEWEQWSTPTRAVAIVGAVAVSAPLAAFLRMLWKAFRG